MAFSEGWKSGYKNRDLAVKSVIGCIISIFGAKKVAIKTVMDCMTYWYKLYNCTNYVLKVTHDDFTYENDIVVDIRYAIGKSCVAEGL